jgi:hypothetical protein
MLQLLQRAFSSWIEITEGVAAAVDFGDMCVAIVCWRRRSRLGAVGPA